MCILNAAGDVCENGSATGTIAAENCACLCDSGYEGDACETESRKNFLSFYYSLYLNAIVFFSFLFKNLC